MKTSDFTLGICDDDAALNVELARKVRRILPSTNIRLFDSAEDLLACSRFPDVLILDVVLPGMTGLEAARCIRAMGCHSVIIFISGHKDYVFDAFDVEAFHYLVKPFSDEQFASVLRAAVQKKDGNDSERKILVTSSGSRICVPIRDICFAEVFNRQIVLHTRRGQIQYYGRLKELEGELGEGFFPYPSVIHRQHAVRGRL